MKPSVIFRVYCDNYGHPSHISRARTRDGKPNTGRLKQGILDLNVTDVEELSFLHTPSPTAPGFRQREMRVLSSNLAKVDRLDILNPGKGIVYDDSQELVMFRCPVCRTRYCLELDDSEFLAYLRKRAMSNPKYLRFDPRKVRAPRDPLAPLKIRIPISDTPSSACATTDTPTKWYRENVTSSC